MQEITTDKLQIAYIIPALRDGRMPMAELAAGLRGQALLIHRVKDILHGESFDVRVEVDPDSLQSATAYDIKIHKSRESYPDEQKGMRAPSD